jgi:chlorosome envelope protein X
MNITINDRECVANTGDRLLDAARANHAHIGYFCGGNALCQTCYVKVLEGADLLAPMTGAEKAMLSDNLISEGYRMACQTIIEKPGTIRLLTTAEEAKRLTLQNPGAIPAYMGRMGMEAAVKFTDTIAFQSRRDAEGHQVSLWQLLTDVVGAIGGAINLLVREVRQAFAGDVV